MPSISIQSSTGGAYVEYSDVIDYSTEGAFCESFESGANKYEYEFFSGAGVDGQGSKNLGYRSQLLKIKVVYVAGSESDCISRALDDNFSIAGSPNTVNANSSTFKGCFLESFDSSQPRSNGFSPPLYYLKSTIVLDAKQID